MSLQVRLRHALGERLIDLADRPVDKPLMIGRSREADVKVPSVTVANEHCALFVHEGHWILQDVSGGATFVNGSALEGPTPLCVGDVIQLGTDASPATIEVDPAGVAQGRSGHPAETHDVPPQPAARPRPPAASPRGQASGAYHPSPGPIAAAPPPPVRPMQQQEEDPWGAQQPAGDDPFASWQQPAGAAPAQETSVRRKKAPQKSSESGMIIGIAIAVAIIGFTGYFVMTHINPPAKPPEAPAAVKADDSSQKGPRTIFQEHPNQPARSTPARSNTPTEPPRTVTPPPADPGAAGSNSATEPPASADTTAKTPEDETWKAVEDATFEKPAQAILKFDDYAAQHPGVRTKDLQTFTDNAMDLLWWDRIRRMCEKRDSLKADLKVKDKEIRGQPDGDFKKNTLLPERQKIVDELTERTATLANDMGYTAEESPNTDMKEVMDKLRADRDESKYGAWKVRTLKFIRSKHGALPWDGE